MYDPEFKVIRFERTPMCTDAQTYEEWREAARRSPPGDAGFCTDCTPEYQQLMALNNRCDHPWVKFKLYEDPEVKTIPADSADECTRMLMKLSDRGIVGYIPIEIKLEHKHRRRFSF